MSGLSDTPDLFDPGHDEWAALYGEQAQPDPEACGLHVIKPTMPGAAALTPYDVPVPSSWRVPREVVAAIRAARAAVEREAQRLAALSRRVPGMVPAARRAADKVARMKDMPLWHDPARMLADVKEAVSELPAQPARVTIFRAISKPTAIGAPLSPDLLNALAAGLGIDPIIKRRDEAMLVREQERHYDHEALEYEGATQEALATEIGKSSRTIRRRKNATVLQFDWEDATAVIASMNELVRGGAWDRTAKTRLFDACRWFARRTRPIPVDLWWAVACAFGLAKGEHGTGCFTDKAVIAIWGAPTTNPAIVPEAAKLRASDESLSNRKLAEKLGVDDGVINRLANVTKMPNADTGMSVLAHAVWAGKIWARWHGKA